MVAADAALFGSWSLGDPLHFGRRASPVRYNIERTLDVVST